MSSHPASGRTGRTQAPTLNQPRVSVGQSLGVWKEAHAQACAAFTKKRDVEVLWRALSGATDALMRALVGNKARGFAVVAVGGYGRGQLFPYSDVDVLIVLPDGKEAPPAIERVLYGLWDLPLKLGHAVRSLGDTIDAARADHTIMTALLDMRFVAGDAALVAKLQKRVSRELIGSQMLPFVEAKLGERDARHARALDSRYVLEPNVKEAKGGLRDLNTIWWLARYCYDIKDMADFAGRGLFSTEDAKAYREALLFLSTLRASLHLLAGRAEERLTFDAQLKLAEGYHYRKKGQEAAKRFMKHYFYYATRVGELTRQFCTLLEEEKKRKPISRMAEFFAHSVRLGPFVMKGERLMVATPTQLAREPLLMLELFAVAQSEGIEIHPHAMDAVARALPKVRAKHRASAEAAQLLKQILLSPHAPDASLRRMVEAGVLQRFIPEFSAIAGQMQYDRYHIYTVDEHTLVAIGNLRRLEQGEWRALMPIATDIIGQVHSREALYLAMLLHDIGKGEGNQTERGERLARSITARMQCAQAEIDTIAWLVGNHLLMSEVAFKRDLDDPQTIADFAAHVHTHERLRLLLLVTVADICAVGPKVWNGWKGALLRDLYKRTLLLLSGEGAARRISDTERGALIALLREECADASTEDISYFVAQAAPPAFWLRPVEEWPWLAALYLRARKDGVAQHIAAHDFHAVTEVTLCLPSDPTLLARVAGAAALMGASIVSAKLMATHDAMSWVSVALQDVTGAAFDAARAQEELLAKLHAVGDGTLDLVADIARARPRYFAARARPEPAQVMIDNSISQAHSVLEVSGADRLGFLHDVAAAIAAQGLVIVSAHVATYGTRAVDVFYLKDAYGHRLEHPAKRDALEGAVMAAVE